MKALVVIITESNLLAQTLDQILSITLRDHIETNYMTYNQSHLSKRILDQTDLFILDLFGYDALGYRAEGIYIAEYFAKTGRKTLLISKIAKANIVGSDYYWDIESTDYLPERVLRLLRQPPADTQDFASLRQVFAPYCRPSYDCHGA